MLTTLKAPCVIKFLPGRILAEVMKWRCFKVWLSWVSLWNWKWVLRALLGVWSWTFCISIMDPFHPALSWDSHWDIEVPLRGSVQNDHRKHLIITFMFPFAVLLLPFYHQILKTVSRRNKKYYREWHLGEQPVLIQEKKCMSPFWGIVLLGDMYVYVCVCVYLRIFMHI